MKLFPILFLTVFSKTWAFGAFAFAASVALFGLSQLVFKLEIGLTKFLDSALQIHAGILVDEGLEVAQLIYHVLW